MKKKLSLTEAILAGIGDAEKDDDRDNVRGEDPSDDDDAPEQRDTLDMAGPPDIDKVVTTDDTEFAPDANMMIKDDNSPAEFTQEERNLVSEFWNAKESYDYSVDKGHPVDVTAANTRMEAAVDELLGMGFFAGERRTMPTLDELGPEISVDVEENVPSSVPSAADPIPQYGEEQPLDNDDLGGDSMIEKMADVAHESWAGWTKYVFSKSTKNDDGTVTIPADQVERWERQIATPYAELSEEEKESDRVEARKYAAAMHSEETPEEPVEPLEPEVECDDGLEPEVESPESSDDFEDVG